MPNEYGTHKDFMGSVTPTADTRKDEIERALREAFSHHIEKKEIEVIMFSTVTVSELAESIFSRPQILKPILASCNIAGRAIARDLGIKNLDTYSPRLSREQAQTIADYVKPFLPPYLSISTLTEIDRVYFIDKQIRKFKGEWEKSILAVLNKSSRNPYRKRTFKVKRDKYELDAATPVKGDIRIGIDVKRIEARQDVQKRCDEIANKARKLKGIYPNSKFGAVVYYPFVNEQVNVENRLRSPEIDAIVFASETNDSITNAIRKLLITLGD